MDGDQKASLPSRQLEDLEYVYTEFDLGDVYIENQAPTDCEGNNNCSEGMFYFHPDHIGSSSFLTDEDGNPYQFLVYLPFGESMAEQKAGGYSTRYRFTSKEIDEETGLYYFGARYYNPSMSLWYGVDPLAEKYPDWSSFNYTLNNPINLIDPNGMDPTPWPKKLLGNLGYYLFRACDFKIQNPGMPVPDYYLEYGNKYIQRFSNETNKTLSSSGKVWLKETRKNLQEAIENRLAQVDGAELERNNDAFRSFAFNSHVEAYWNSNGEAPLYSLGAIDLTKILLTPNAKDLLSDDGMRQVKDIISKFINEKPEDLNRILNEAYLNKSEIFKLVEEKAKKEFTQAAEIIKALIPFIELIPEIEK